MAQSNALRADTLLCAVVVGAAALGVLLSPSRFPQTHSVVDYIINHDGSYFL